MNTYQLGCIIDGSHWSAADIDHAVITYAETRGWTVGWMDAPYGDVTDWEAWLSEVADEAITWLNDHYAPEGTAYFFDDNSLFLEPTDWDG